ncbi:MAG TPA: hypothetical protein VEX15_21040 [Nocardioidaceae bacterium]|nr:hypothetical protein [Nocardioidaceae bacterium]
MFTFSTHLGLGGMVAAVAVIVAAAAGGTWLLLGSDEDEPGWSSDGITLNTSSWEPGDDADDAGIVGVVRIDANGCVHLRRKGRAAGVDVIWPAGYTASRQDDGTVTIMDPDDVVVAATGHRLRAGGGAAPSDTEFACRARNTRGTTPVMIEDELPPLAD